MSIHDLNEPKTLDLPSMGSESPTLVPAGAGPAESPPASVSGYDILAELGRGGMGVVYKAHQLSLNRIVALKMILAGSHAGMMELVRFRQEAEVVARLQHPNIVQIYEVGVHAGHSFLSLEFVEGGSLARKTAGQPQPLRDAARLVELLACAVEYAHQNGIVHRDLSPGNVLLTADGAPKLSDFGLARRIGDSEGMTATGAILGTPGYLSPEQIAGRKSDIGPATDVYGLGAILYYLLTGRPPFQAGTLLDTIRLTESQEPVPPRRLRPEVSRDLDTICLKCLHKNLAQRYASAADLAADLHRFQAGEPIQARPVGTLERGTRWARRNPFVAGLMTTVGLLLAVVAVGGLVFSIQLANALSKARTDRDRALVAEQEGKEKLFRALLSEAQTKRFSRRPGQRFRSLAVIRQAVALARELDLPEERFAELRTEAIASLMLPDIEVYKELDGLPAGYYPFAIDGSFQRYAYGDSKGEVTVRRVADGREDCRLFGGGVPLDGYFGVQFSPDGRFLHQRWRTARGGRSRLWRLDAPPVAIVDDDHYGFAFSPDSKAFAGHYSDDSIRIFELPTGREQRRFASGAQSPGSALLWNPRLPNLTIWNRQVWRNFDPDTGKLQREGRPHPRITIDWLDWHSEGRLLAYGGSDMRIRLWDAQTGQPVGPILEGHKTPGILTSFNCRGDRLLSNDWASSIRLWDTKLGRQLLALPAGGTTLYLSANEEYLAADVKPTKVRLFRYHSGREFRTIVSRTATGVGQIHGSVALRGQLLAAYSSSGLLLIDWKQGEVLATIPPGHHRPLRFEATSNALLTYGVGGLIRWPMQADPKAKDTVRIGPPEFLLASQVGDLWASTGDGQVIAIPNYSRGAIVHHQKERRVVHLSPQDDVRCCAISPDGRWVATGTHHHRKGSGAKVWDSVSGQHAKDIPVPGGTVGFSPDGRWLVTTGGGIRLWRVDTWEPGPNLNATSETSFAFAPDGKVLALGGIPGLVRLVNPNTGSTIAQLPAPEESRLHPLCFSPEGTQLILQGGETSALHIIDLRAIREQLRPLGLDWDAPAYPPEPADNDRPAPLKVEVVSAERMFEEQKAIQQAKDGNSEAWKLLVGPAETRDPARALKLAREAVRLDPKEPLYLNTLGVALYRNKEHREAIAILEKSIAGSKGAGDGFDLFFLAMSFAKLGELDKAKDRFDRAVRWVEKQANLPANYASELKAFREEAEAELKLASKKDS